MKKPYLPPSSEVIEVKIERNIMSVTGKLPGSTGWDDEDDDE